MAKRRELTAKEKACAARARAFWEDLKKRKKLSQLKAAETIGMSASAFNQYINAVIPLNTDATAKLAGLFSVLPRDIDPDWLLEPDSLSIPDAAVRAVFEDALQRSNKEHGIAALKVLADKLSPADSLKIAQIFLDRVQADLAKPE